MLSFSRRRLVLPTLALTLGVALSASCAWATSFFPRPFPDTIENAPIIVRGHIGSSNSDWGKGSDGTRRLYTFYDLNVEEVFKGDAEGPSLSIRELGGEKDGIGMQIAGAAHFERGEDVVVLLGAQNPDGTYDVHGLMMAKFNLEKDESGTEYLAGPALDPQAHDDDDAKGNTHSHKWSLQALRDLVKAQAAAPAPAGKSRGQPVSRVSTVSPSSSPAPQLQPASPAEETSPDSEEAERRFRIRAILALGIGLGLGIWGLRFFRKKNR